MGSFIANISRFGYRSEIQAEIIGHLAIHNTLRWSEDNERTLTLSHAASGYYVWEFDAWVQREDIQRLAHLLSGQDFDAYYRAGCKDKAFVIECRRIFAAWEAAVPNRLAHDCISDDQHVPAALADNEAE